MSRQQHTQTGEVLTIADAAARPPISLIVYGESEQSGTPTPSDPVPIDSVSNPVFVNSGTSTTIDLNGGVLGSVPAGVSVLTDGAQDVLTIDANGAATLMQATATVTFVGADSEGWSRNSNGAMLTTVLKTLVYTPPSNTRLVPFLCSHCEADTYGNVAGGTTGAAFTAIGTFGIRIGTFATVDAWKTWLASNPVTIVYPLATEQTIDLGTVSLPNLQDGTAYISASVTPTITLAYWAWALELIFDGHYIADLFSIERHATRTLGAWEPNLVDVSGRNGQLFAGTRLLPTQLTFDLYAIDGTRGERQAAFRTLAAWLAVDEPKRLELGDEGGLYRYAIPTGESVQEAYLNADHAEVTFICPDPRLYGATETANTANAQNGATISVTVGGTAPTEPRLTGTATGNSAGLWKLVDETGAGIYYAIPDGTSYAFVADCANRTLTLNGNTVMLPPTYDWMSWEPGAHTLTMTGGASDINVSWPTRWW